MLPGRGRFIKHKYSSLAIQQTPSDTPLLCIANFNNLHCNFINLHVLNTEQPKSSQLFDIKIRVNGCTFFQPTIYSLSKSFTSHRIYSPQNSSDYKFQGPPSSYSITPVCIPCLYPSGNRLKNVPSSNLVASSVFRINSKSFCSGC